MQKLLSHTILSTVVGFFLFFQVWPVTKLSVSLKRKFPTYGSSTKGKLLLHFWGSLSKWIVWANEQQGKRTPLSVRALIPSVQNLPAHTQVTLKHSLIFWWIFISVLFSTYLSDLNAAVTHVQYCQINKAKNQWLKPTSHKIAIVCKLLNFHFFKYFVLVTLL